MSLTFCLRYFLFNFFYLTITIELTICPVKRELLAITRYTQRDEVATSAAQLQAIKSFKSLKFSKAGEKFKEVFPF